ncbi:MAG: hypothetical protein ACOY7T_12465 [Pseudomonadota bacterium]
MITLPAGMVPNSAKVALIDFGFVQRPALGGAVSRINRPGNRWQVELTWPPMRAEDAGVLVRRLSSAVGEGLRVPFPLQGVAQGTPGVVIEVNGSGAAGTSLPVRGLAAGQTIQEGWWLTAIDSDGRYYLHQVAAQAVANGSGQATITITPMLRAPLVDGNDVLLGTPMVEGVITGRIGWDLVPGSLIDGVGCVIEEAA